MRCAEIRELLSAYVDGVLSTDETDFLEAHLGSCKACREELVRLEKTVHLLQSLPQVPLPVDFTARLHERLNAVVQEPPVLPVKKTWARRLARSPWFSLGAAAALLFVIWTAVNPMFYKTPLSDLAQSKTAGLQPSVLKQAENQSAASQPAAGAGQNPDPTASRSSMDPAADGSTEQSGIKEELPLMQKSAAKDVVVEKNGDGNKAARQNSRRQTEKSAAAAGSDAAASDAFMTQATIMAKPAAKAVPDSAADSRVMITGAEDLALPMENPIVIQSASLTMTVNKTKFSSVCDKIAAVYKVESADEEKGVIIFQVPKEEWDKAIVLLRGTGTLSDMQKAKNDLSTDYFRTAQRLTEYRQRRQDVLKALAESENPDERVHLEVEQQYLNGEIDLLEGRLSFLKKKASLVETKLSVKGFSPAAEE